MSTDRGAAGDQAGPTAVARLRGGAHPICLGMLGVVEGLSALLAVDMGLQQQHDGPDATKPVCLHTPVKAKSLSKMASHHLGFAHDCLASDLGSLTSTISLRASSQS